MVGSNSGLKFYMRGEPTFAGQHLGVDFTVAGLLVLAFSSRLSIWGHSSVAFRAALSQLALFWPTCRGFQPWQIEVAMLLEKWGLLVQRHCEANEMARRGKCRSWARMVGEAPLLWYGRVLRTGSFVHDVPAHMVLQRRGLAWRWRVRAKNRGKLMRGWYALQENWTSQVVRLIDWAQFQPWQIEAAAVHDNWDKGVQRHSDAR
jgi:hypothetical protein